MGKQVARRGRRGMQQNLKTEAVRLAATPFTRLIVLTALGLAAFALLSLLSLQPQTGWSWSPTL